MTAVTMLSRLSIFLVILLLSNIKGQDYGGGGIPTNGPARPTPISPQPSSSPSPPSKPSPSPSPSPSPEPSPSPSPSPPSSPPAGNSSNNITGQWYIVMSNNCGDKGTSKMVCNCLTVYFRLLEPDNWQIYKSSIKKETNSLVVSMGGVQALSSGGTEFKGFILSATEVPTSVLSTETNYTISQAIHGCSAYSQFEMSIIGYSEENSYMITTVKYEETDYTLVWSRVRAPGKETIWTKIVENLNSLSINPHDLKFVQQLDCKIPSLNQYDEMFFCA